MEAHRPWFIRTAFSACATTFRFHRLKLLSCLLPITNGVVGTEWNLLAARKQELLAAFHQVLLIKCPGIHEILQHDHDHVLSDVTDSQALGNAACLAGERELLSRFLRTRHRRR